MMKNRFLQIEHELKQYKRKSKLSAAPSSRENGTAKVLAQSKKEKCQQMSEVAVSADQFVIDILYFFYKEELQESELNDELREIAAKMLWTATEASKKMDLIPRPPKGVPSLKWLASEAVQIAFRTANNKCIYEAVRKTTALKWRSAYQLAKINLAEAQNRSHSDFSLGKAWTESFTEDEASKLKEQMAKAIAIYETNRGGSEPKVLESTLSTVAGVKASVKSVGQYIVSRAITVLNQVPSLRKLVKPALTGKAVHQANTVAASVVELLKKVNLAGVKADKTAFKKKHKNLIQKTGLADSQVDRMFSALELLQTIKDLHKTISKNKTPKQLAATIPEADRLGLGLGSLTAYIRHPGKWGENRAAWVRLAVEKMANQVGKRIIEVAEHNDGKSMFYADIGFQIAKLQKASPGLGTRELLLKIAAKHNNDPNYANNVLKEYERLNGKTQEKEKGPPKATKSLMYSLGQSLHVMKNLGQAAANEEKDVLALKKRFHELGFDWVPIDKQMDQATIRSIKLFQSIIQGLGSIKGDGLIEVAGSSTPTYDWLRARNAPRWLQIPASGTGYKDSDNPAHNKADGKVAMNWGTSWLIDTIKMAGLHYETNYRKGNTAIPVIHTNDLSLSQGGDTKDHKGHETGLLVDLRLPRTDGRVGGINWKHDLYDQNAIRAMIKAFRAQPLFSVCYFNDKELIKEGLCKPQARHDDHVHIQVKPPTIRLNLNGKQE